MDRASNPQFSVAEMFEAVTLCAVMAAFSRAVGPVAAGFLMAMALALGARQGLLALAMFACGMSAAEASGLPTNSGLPASDAWALLWVVLLGAVPTAWYRMRRESKTPRAATP